MKIRTLVEQPERELSDALQEFERSFQYPLGVGRSFRIVHGEDYSRFYRAIDAGSGATFVAVSGDGRVRGTLGVAVRPLQYPDGECRRAAYLGDLKTAPGVSRGLTLLRLSVEVTKWSKAHGAVVAYGVVMDATPREPSDYTGKLGIYPFRKVSEIALLRIPVDRPAEAIDSAFEADSAAVEECFRHLAKAAFVPLGGSPALRSLGQPIALLAPDHSACGILEDTRQAKRLIGEDGEEIISAHLSRFAFASPAAGAKLVRQALARCACGGITPAVFVAVPAGGKPAFLAQFDHLPGVVPASATIFGTWPDLAADRWNISPAEI